MQIECPQLGSWEEQSQRNVDFAQIIYLANGFFMAFCFL